MSETIESVEEEEEEEEEEEVEEEEVEEEEVEEQSLEEEEQSESSSSTEEEQEENEEEENEEEEQNSEENDEEQDSQEENSDEEEDVAMTADEVADMASKISTMKLSLPPLTSSPSVTKSPILKVLSPVVISPVVKSPVLKVLSEPVLKSSTELPVLKSSTELPVLKNQELPVLKNVKSEKAPKIQELPALKKKKKIEVQPVSREEIEDVIAPKPGKGGKGNKREPKVVIPMELLDKAEKKVKKGEKLDDLLVRDNTENDEAFLMRSAYSKAAEKVVPNETTATYVLIGQMAYNRAKYGMTYPPDMNNVLNQIDELILKGV